MARKLRKAIKEWNYEVAVQQLKPMISDLRKRTVDVVRLLYRANKELAAQGFRTDLIEKLNNPTSTQMNRSEIPKTWEQFCEEIGVPKPTANRWLALYDPDEDRLLSTEEAKERALAIRDALFEDVRAHRTSGQPDWRPERWNDRLESQYKIWLIEKGYDELPEPEYYGTLPRILRHPSTPFR